jgi:hypothetical protein
MMDHRFRDIYREQIELYRGIQVHRESWWADTEQSNLRALAIVTEAIEEALTVLPNGLSIRPDAKLFLLINLHQLVTMPLSDRRSPTDLSVEVENGIKSDVKMIINASVEFSSKRKEIAASHVVWGLAKVLDKLSLKSWRLWEIDE